MRRRPARSSAGFTLVELLVGVTLSAALMAAVLSTYVYLARNLARLANQQTLETESRRALGFFAQDVQSATGVTITAVTAPDFQVSFGQPAAPGGATQAIYYYSRDGTSATMPGGTVEVPAGSLVRVLASDTAVLGSAQILARHIVPALEGCAIRFFDSAGNAYDNGEAPYTPVAAYAAGIKQASLQFGTQAGTAASGTLTRVHHVSSSRLVLRNRVSLP